MLFSRLDYPTAALLLHILNLLEKEEFDLRWKFVVFLIQWRMRINNFDPINGFNYHFIRHYPLVKSDDFLKDIDKLRINGFISKQTNGISYSLTLQGKKLLTFYPLNSLLKPEVMNLVLRTISEARFFKLESLVIKIIQETDLKNNYGEGETILVPRETISPEAEEEMKKQLQNYFQETRS